MARSRIRSAGLGGFREPQPLKLTRYISHVGGRCRNVPGGFVIGEAAGSVQHIGTDERAVPMVPMTNAGSPFCKGEPHPKPPETSNIPCKFFQKQKEKKNQARSAAYQMQRRKLNFPRQRREKNSFPAPTRKVLQMKEISSYKKVHPKLHLIIVSDDELAAVRKKSKEYYAHLPENNTNRAIISSNCSSDEADVLRFVAARQRKSLSAWLREAAIQKAYCAECAYDPGENPSVEEMAGELLSRFLD